MFTVPLVPAPNGPSVGGRAGVERADSLPLRRRPNSYSTRTYLGTPPPDQPSRTTTLGSGQTPCFWTEGSRAPLGRRSPPPPGVCGRRHGPTSGGPILGRVGGPSGNENDRFILTEVRVGPGRTHKDPHSSSPLPPGSCATVVLSPNREDTRLGPCLPRRRRNAKCQRI